MSTYLMEVKDEESFFYTIRKIIKEELRGNSISKIGENSPTPIPYIKVSDVCEMLHVSRPTVDEWVEKGFFKKYKVNSRTFYNRDEILEFLSKQGK